MKSALVGYTGFVGHNLHKQNKFDYLFNSRNISEIQNKKFDLVVCAAAPGAKWIANNNPKEDWRTISTLMENISQAKVKKFILISTVDVYPLPKNVNEETKILSKDLMPYGKNRLKLERFIRSHFENYLIIRLPGLFGSGLKKNFIFDLINSNALDYTDERSIFQFYDLNDLWKDINKVLEKDIKIINFATEPISAKDLAKRCFNIRFINKTNGEPANYDVHTEYAHVFKSKTNYLYGKDEIFARISKFIRTLK